MTSTENETFARTLTIPLGVVVAREALDHPWQSHVWRPLSVFLGAPAISAWRELQRGPGFEHYHAATLLMELHRNETAGYKINLSNGVPSIYVVLRETPENDNAPLDVHLVTASPFDVQAYGANSGEIIGRVTMPDELVELVTAFIATHHVEDTFRKRQRQPHVEEEAHLFGNEPIHLLHERMRRAGRNPRPV